MFQIARMSKSLASLALFTTLSTALAETDKGPTDNYLSCWDQSFAYNTASIKAVDDGFEVMLQGSQLAGDKLRTIDSAEFTLFNNVDPVWLPQLAILVKLPLGSCTLNVAEKTAQCSAAGTDKVFLSWMNTEIGISPEARHPIVPYGWNADQDRTIEFSLSTQGATLKLSGTEQSSNERKVNNVFIKPRHEEVRTLSCNIGEGNNSTINPQFPQRLRDHLKSH